VLAGDSIIQPLGADLRGLETRCPDVLPDGPARLTREYDSRFYVFRPTNAIEVELEGGILRNPVTTAR